MCVRIVDNTEDCKGTNMSNKPRSQRMTCQQQLKGINFLGGTFVEFWEGSNREFGRSKITKFECQDDAFCVDTEASDQLTGLKLGAPHLRSTASSILNRNGEVWYIDAGPYLNFVCAIAPEGVEI